MSCGGGGCEEGLGLCRIARPLQWRDALNSEMDHSSILHCVRGKCCSQFGAAGGNLLLNLQVDVCGILSFILGWLRLRLDLGLNLRHIFEPATLRYFDWSEMRARLVAHPVMCSRPRWLPTPASLLVVATHCRKHVPCVCPHIGYFACAAVIV